MHKESINCYFIIVGEMEVKLSSNKQNVSD